MQQHIDSGMHTTWLLPKLYNAPFLLCLKPSRNVGSIYCSKNNKGPTAVSFSSDFIRRHQTPDRATLEGWLGRTQRPTSANGLRHFRDSRFCRWADACAACHVATPVHAGAWLAPSSTAGSAIHCFVAHSVIQRPPAFALASQNGLAEFVEPMSICCSGSTGIYAGMSTKKWSKSRLMNICF